MFEVFGDAEQVFSEFVGEARVPEILVFAVWVDPGQVVVLVVAVVVMAHL